MCTTSTPAETMLSTTTPCIAALSLEHCEPEQNQDCWETILLVEDEASVRAVTQEVLEMCGYTVLTASDAAEAIRVFERHNETIHLLVTDVVMPGMNGRDLANRLRQRCPNLKTIFVSGYANDAITHEGNARSAAGYLQKPFTLHALTSKVREVIDASRREGALHVH